eukprot:GHVU01076734.1.p1 GENE.GHVU01076734.1~~GHVU01076734.1.p1  ORF type:complete len:185 (+),score=55.44 GHVU01076734.1:26-556(+)
MVYGNCAPSHKAAVAATPLQAALALVKSDASLETMNKLVRNCAQNPGEEKYRKIRLTNDKIAAVLVAVEGAKAAMLAMGWVEDGEFLVLPAGVQLSMKEVRDIEDAKAKLKKEEEQALMRAALPKKKEDPEMKRLREQLEADKKERAARGPITQASVAAPRGQGGIVQFQPPAQSG